MTPSSDFASEIFHGTGSASTERRGCTSATRLMELIQSGAREQSFVFRLVSDSQADSLIFPAAFSITPKGASSSFCCPTSILRSHVSASTASASIAFRRCSFSTTQSTVVSQEIMPTTSRSIS